jgi:hypothetical protein
VLVIDGNKNSEPREKKIRNIRRDSGFYKCRQGPRDRLVGGAKVETFEHLDKLLSQRD